MQKPKVGAISLKMDGVAYYRALLPLNELERQGKAIFIPHRRLYEADVVLLDRIFLAPFHELLLDLKCQGIRLLYGIDDDPFDVPAYHPSFEMYRHEEIQKNLINALRLADLVVAASEHLKMVLHERVGDDLKIQVIGNYLDFNSAWNSDLSETSGPYTKPADKLIIGWAGSPVGHRADLALLQGVFHDLIELYGDRLLFRFMGDFPDFIAGEIPKGYVEFHKWVDVTQFPQVLAWLGFDIALIPLEDDRHNRSKTNVKFLEFSALHVPSVMSNVGPYQNTPADCGVLTLNDRASWVNALRRLIENPVLRLQMGNQAYKHVRQYYDISQATRFWHEALISVSPPSERRPFVLPVATSKAAAGPIDIIIPIGNLSDDYRGWLDSIIENTDLNFNSIILIDDGSKSRELKEYLRSQTKRNAHISLIEHDQPVGFLKACNLGIGNGKRDVVFVHPHIQVSNAWLDKITACAYSDPTIGVVSPLTNENNLLGLEIRALETPLSDLNKFLETRCLPYYELPFAMAPCFFVKHGVLEKYGILDESLGSGWGQEIDLCLRIKSSYRTALDTRTLVYHKAGVDPSDVCLPSKEEMERNTHVLKHRYPLYRTQLETWKNSDSIRNLKNKIIDGINLKPLFLMSLFDKY